jgi:hypothetical protein
MKIDVPTASKWAVRALIGEGVFIALSILTLGLALLPAIACALAATGLGLYLSVKFKRHRYLIVSFVAAALPIWLLIGLILGLH